MSSPSRVVCEPCRCAERAREQDHLRSLGQRWTVNGYLGGGPRPRLVVQTKKHRESLGALTAAEAADLGPLLRFVAVEVARFSGAERVYVALLNEASPAHVHLHIIPRFAGDPPEVRGWKIQNAPPPAAVKIDSRDLARTLGERWVEVRPEEPSVLVRLVVRALGAARALSLYSLAGRLKWVREHPSGTAELYVPLWLSALLAVLLLSPSNQSELTRGTLAAGSLAAYRFADIISFELLVLLHRGQRSLQSYTRSFLLLGLNLVEVAVGAAVFFRLNLPLTQWQAFILGSEVATLRGGVPAGAGVATEIAVTVGSAGALVLLAGGLSLVVGLISSEFEEGT